MTRQSYLVWNLHYVTQKKQILMICINRLSAAYLFWSVGSIRFSENFTGHGCQLNIYIYIYLPIIPRARMGYESIAHEAEGRMGY